MLTSIQIKSARPRDKAYKLADSGGLYLQVQPSGAKLWRYKFRVAGVEGKESLGAFPEVSLARARALHAAARQLVAQGIHPVRAKQQLRVTQASQELERKRGTFAAVLAEWHSTTSVALRPTTVRQRRREIDKDLVPTLEHRAMNSITRMELTALLKGVEERAPEIARKLRIHLWSIFEYAVDTGLLENNPVPPRRVMRNRDQTNHPALPRARIGDFLRALDAAAAINEETRIAMLLVLLTGCRKTEIIEARWAEVELKAASWDIPAARMKGKLPHWVPLSRQAVELLARLRKIVPVGQEHLFPNRRDPRRPMASRSMNALMDRLGFGHEGTPHGMRAAFSTHFNSLGASEDVIERCLAHVPRNAVRAAYNRYAYQAERRAMLQSWADHLDRLRAGNETVQEIRQRRAQAQRLLALDEAVHAHSVGAQSNPA
jgi:integrase